jgi:anti-anti-sigma factor
VNHLRIETRDAEGVCVVALEGRVTIGETGQSVKDRVQQLADEGCTRLLMNLEKVEYMDSAGIGALVSAYMSINKKGGHFAFCSPSVRMRGLLEITRLDKIVAIHPDEASGVSALTG